MLFKDLTFAIVDSGIRHSTGDIHPNRQKEINLGLEALMENPTVPAVLKAKLGYRFDKPLWEEITEQELTDFLSGLKDKAKRRILFTIRMQKLTEFALKILRLEKVSKKETALNLGKESLATIEKSSIEERGYWILGETMNHQHALLRDLYDVASQKSKNSTQCLLKLEPTAQSCQVQAWAEAS